MIRVLAVLIAAVLLSGCGHVRAEHVLTGQPRARHAGEVKVVMEGAPLSGECDEIAVVTATGTLEEATLSAVLDALKRKAASLGANAVVRVRYDRGASGATATGVAVVLR